MEEEIQWKARQIGSALMWEDRKARRCLGGGKAFLSRDSTPSACSKHGRKAVPRPNRKVRRCLGGENAVLSTAERQCPFGPCQRAGRVALQDGGQRLQPAKLHRVGEDPDLSTQSEVIRAISFNPG